MTVLYSRLLYLFILWLNHMGENLTNQAKQSKNDMLSLKVQWSRGLNLRRRMRQKVYREWYHFMVSSARIGYDEQVLHCQRVLKLASTVRRGASTRVGLPLISCKKSPYLHIQKYTHIYLRIIYETCDRRPVRSCSICSLVIIPFIRSIRSLVWYFQTVRFGARY